MRFTADANVEFDLDRCIAAFEDAKNEDLHADPASFLPDHDDPLYLEVLREVVRVDLEYSWADGIGQPLGYYRRRFPELFDDPPSLQAICFEDFRLRQQARQYVSVDEYQSHYGVDARSWPIFEEINGANTNGASHPNDAKLRDGDSPRRAMPKTGDTLLGFELIGELGRGAFATVFLARQHSLADRLVAIKVSRTRIKESDILARLQHTNIVPVYSVHSDGPFQIICMPFFGSTTLADLLREMRGSQSVPDSGRALVETIGTRQGFTQRKNASRSATTGSYLLSPDGTDESVKVENASPANRSDVALCLKSIAQLTHVEAVLWIGSRLAEGLHHAHERGILHRDLKPANVLMADDGQPMLLDFNLSEARSPAAGATVEYAVEYTFEFMGGTLPYMAPENLLAYQEGTKAGDVRSDVYSLGVILFELLTCRQPFPMYKSPEAEALPQMLADRRGVVPGLRCWNKSISPAVEAIVQKCLAPDPTHRYASADELREDLDRQLKHQPLHYAPDRSLRERAVKWIRRHPRLASASSIAAIAIAIIALLASGLAYRSARLTHLEALDNFAEFQSDMRKAQVQLLDAPTAGRTILEEAADNCRQALRHFDAIEHEDWQDHTRFRSLSPQQQARAREDVGELLFLMAAIDGLKSDASSQSSSHGDHLVQAIALNRRAEKCYPADAIPGAVWRQRAIFTKRQGDVAEAKESLQKADAQPPKTARDYAMAACVLTSQRRFRAALPLWQQASALDSQNIWAWYGLGHCYDQLSQPTQAVSCYTACIALSPEFHGWYFNRGLNYLRLKQYSLARTDFDKALQLWPGQFEARFNRALASLGEHRYSDAILDLENLISHEHDDTRTRLLLAQVKENAGDAEGAKRERAAGMKCTPLDDKACVAAAIAESMDDPAKAVKDLDRALEFNAFSEAALESKANLLAEQLGRTRDAARVLDRAVAIYPENGSLVAARGVLQARLNCNDEALHDAQSALQLDASAATSYQVAGIYALLSRTESSNIDKAIALLANALRNGYGESLIAEDKDLDPIRQSRQFQVLISAMHTLHPTSSASPSSETPRTDAD